MASPSLMSIIGTRDYNFTGGDGLPHHLTNHNLFLDLYPGSTGLKTGTTDLAGHTFVGSATRGGRSMMVVVFDAVDSYASAGALLDQGFNMPVASEVGLDHLPPVVANASIPPPPTTLPPAPVVANPSKNGSFVDSTEFALMVLIAGLLPLRALRRRVLAKHAAHDIHDDHRGPDRSRELVRSG